MQPFSENLERTVFSILMLIQIILLTFVSFCVVLRSNCYDVLLIITIWKTISCY